MIGSNYLARQAATLLQLARFTRDTRQAVRLAAKAAELQERSDAALSIDLSPMPRGVEGRSPPYRQDRR